MLEKIFEEAMKTPYDQRVVRAKENSHTVLEYMKQYGKKEEAATVYLSVIAAFAGADGRFEEKEYLFLKDVFGFDVEAEKLAVVIRFYNTPSMIDSIEKLMDAASEDIKKAFAMLGVDVCASDGEMSEREKELIERFLF